MSDLLSNPFHTLTPSGRERASKAEQNRVNAAQSTGPKTPEGKAAVAQNARKHGFAGATVVIEDEDRDAYDMHLEAYFSTFQPINHVESDLIRRAANAQWKCDRLSTIEATLIEWEAGFQAPIADAALDKLESRHYWSLALKALSAERAFDLCRRYQTSLQRDYDRAINMFLKLKKERPVETTEPLPAPSPNTSARKPKLAIMPAPNKATPKPDKPVIQPTGYRKLMPIASMAA